MKRIIIKISFIIMFCIILVCIYIINNEEIKELKLRTTSKEIVDTNKISILYYKYIGDCEVDTCITENNFNLQMNFLAFAGYKTITLDELKKWKNNEIELPQKSVLLLIENDYKNVDKILKQYNFILNNLGDYKLYFKNYSVPFNKDSLLNDIPVYLIKKNTNLAAYNNFVKGNIIEKEYDLSELATEIPVLNYHFLYEYPAGCNEEICLNIKLFEEQLTYLNENNYKTLTINEFNDWLNGNIELPKKSVLITFDDGACGTSLKNGNHLITLIEKYNVKATLYLITSFWNINDYISPNLNIQSHTYNLHNNTTCGFDMACKDLNTIKADLIKSLDIVKDNTSFAYPFYYYNNTIISILKELDFKFAFVGGNYKAARNTNKYLIPRYVIYNGITLNEFINMIE